MGRSQLTQQQLPTLSNFSGEAINWSMQISDTFNMMQNIDGSTSSSRSQTIKFVSEQRSSDKRMDLILAALKAGHVDMAMMLLSHEEARSAQEINKTLVGKLQGMQEQKKGMINQLQGNQMNQQQLQGLQQQINSVGDDISMLQSFIKEVNDSKNRSLEFANNFMSTEHQTAMSIIRSMR